MVDTRLVIALGFLKQLRSRSVFGDENEDEHARKGIPKKNVIICLRRIAHLKRLDEVICTNIRHLIFCFLFAL